ncbi:MAG: response regulator, partial [Chloroflexota bacterium]|nr:response regulator [Chloroflexota bacterium]
MASGRLLVVDDEASVAVTMAAILERDGYEVATCTNGSEAMRALRESAFDLVLTDLRLDDADGLSIINEACRIQPDTVSIILTGYASLESAIKALRQGAYDYLIKPCDVEELRAVVARGIERRQLSLQLKRRLGELEYANATIHELNHQLRRRVEHATSALQERMDELSRANS